MLTRVRSLLASTSPGKGQSAPPRARPGSEALVAVTPYRMRPLELASGMVFGVDPTVRPLAATSAGLTARAALENVVLCALQLPPCGVSFSGGRDSSVVLALAAHVARRHKLPPPIPVTKRFPRCPQSCEDSWQELVIKHLDIQDWVRLEFDDELDIVGPHAQVVLGRHGLLWPFNVHGHLPMAGQVPGGVLLTGFGGDELFSPGAVWLRVNQVLGRTTPMVPRDLLRIAVAYGPAGIRRTALRRRFSGMPLLPWLQPAAAHELLGAMIEVFTGAPVRWDASIDQAWWRTQYRSAAENSLTQVGMIHDTEVISPFTDPAVLSAVAREGGRAGFPSRTAALRHLVGDLLPPEILARESKASLTGAFWTRHAADFAATWDGAGVDSEIIDIEALRRCWTQAPAAPDARTFSLLQSVWHAAANPPVSP